MGDYISGYDSVCDATPRAAYVHVPFCRHRCGYCNFTVIAQRDDLIPSYLAALEIELRQLEYPRTVSTLYVGGGTPSHLTGSALSDLLQQITRWLVPTEQAEFTIEANPEDLDDATCCQLAAHGVNRVSLGVQSFQPRKVTVLERHHSPLHAHQAITAAQRAGHSVAIDLIFAAPGESIGEWRADLAEAIESGVDHISTYGLTVERGTRFWSRRYHGEWHEVDETEQRRFYCTAMEMLEGAGFEHYEVSNFARPGCRSRHNQVYWRGEPYLAFGPGASRYVDGTRQTNHRSTFTYIRRMESQRHAIAEQETLSDEGRTREALVLGLRMRAGIEISDFERRFACSLPELVGRPWEWFQREGWWEIDQDRLRLTLDGLLISDSLWPYLLSE